MQVSLLSVLIPAQVEPYPATGMVVARAGSSVTLECRASGNPMPDITWKKVNDLKQYRYTRTLTIFFKPVHTSNMKIKKIQKILCQEKSNLPSGSKFQHGSSLNIPSVAREHAGLFVCMADNGVGNQAVI